MKPVLTPKQMRELDRRTIEELGIPGMVLMELAARGVALEVEKILRGLTWGSRVLVFCGPGNNGGDGFAVARRLMNLKAEVTVLLLADRGRIKGDALTNLNIYEKLDGEIIHIKNSDDIEDLPDADIIVDALLGTGLHGAAEGLMADTIRAINESPAPVVSVDIPSGINGANGADDGPAVFSDVTATFGELKAGLLLQNGLEYSGEIVRVDIQIPPDFVEEIDCSLFLVSPDDIMVLIPERSPTTHKGQAGKVLMIAGSVGMTGAAELAAKACLRVGAGLVKVAVPGKAQAILAARNTEVMTIPLDDSEEGSIAPEAESVIREIESWAEIEVIGPGISLNPETVSWFGQHAQKLTLPTVIDADGLNALAKNREILRNLNPEIILTPHIGEFSRLTELSIDEINADRVEIVKKFAAKWNVTLILKGVPTLISAPGEPVFALLTGNPGMASAGMGDVLTGVVAGLMAQGLSPLDSAIAGVAIHGLAGDLASEQYGSTGIIAGDLIEQLPLAQDILAERVEIPHKGCSGNCEGGNCGGGGCGGGNCECG